MKDGRAIQRVASFLVQQTGQGVETEAVLVYAMQVLLITVFNIVLTLTLGWVLGVIYSTISCLLTAVVFRHTAGGAHSQSPWKCAVITMAIFPLLALIARRLSFYASPYTDIISIFMMLSALFLIIRFAPVDNEAAPIVSIERRKQLRGLSFAVFFIVCGIVIFIRQSTWPLAKEIYLSMVLGVMWSTFNLSGPGHRLMSFVDGIHFNERGES